MSSIKGILIDPTERTIQEVDVQLDSDGSSLYGMYQKIECNTVDCARGCFEFLGCHDDLWFDDEGKIRGETTISAFVLPNCVPIVRKGLILGWNDDGESVNHTFTPEKIEELKKRIQWGFVKVEI